MYLTKINPNTGLVDVSDVKDGVLAIKQFRDLINDENYGIECFTCVALAADHASPIHYYEASERYLKAMRNVTGSSETYHWFDDIIQDAYMIYQELQFHPKLEKMKIIQEMEIKKLRELQNETDYLKKQLLLTDLKKIEQNQKDFLKENRDLLLEESPAKGNYKLSRLEQKLKNRKTFYYVRRENKPGTDGKLSSKSAGTGNTGVKSRTKSKSEGKT